MRLTIPCVLIFLHLAVADHDSNSIARRHSSLVHRKRLLSEPFTHQPELSKREDGSRLTWFADGLGACGIVNTPHDFIVALNSDQFGEGFPGPHCFETITIDCNGVQRQALITDRCPGCPYKGLDLSTGLFQQFAPLSTGVLYCDWWFGGAAPPPSPSPPPPPPPSTHMHTSTPPPPPPSTPTPPPPPPSSSTKKATSSSVVTTTSSAHNATSTNSTSILLPTPNLNPDLTPLGIVNEPENLAAIGGLVVGIGHLIIQAP